MKPTLILSTTLTLACAGPLLADQVISDDLIVVGNLCVGGADCLDGEAFGNADIKIKSGLPQIAFVDTDASTHNWIVSVDDTSSGVTNGFSIENETNGTYPLIIDQDAPSNTLFASADGNVGIGTSLPEANLHLFDTLFPALILEQLGLVKWQLQAAGGDLIFLDVTAGRKRFEIERNGTGPGMHFDSDGHLGVGTTSPDSLLNLEGSTADTKILVENTSGTTASREMFQMKNKGGSYFTLSNTNSARDWFFTHENASGGRFIITSSTNPSQGLFLTPTGDLKIGGTLTTAGSCSVGCDRVFDADYNLPDMQDHHAAMWEKGYLPNVGPTPEDGPFNVTDKLGRMLNELEHAHIYIDQLHDRLETQDDVNQQLIERLAALEQIVQNQ